MTATPPIVDRETWQKQIDTQRVRERAHTREGTRLPRLAGGCRWSRSPRRQAVVGAAGGVPLIDTFPEPVAAVCVGPVGGSACEPLGAPHVLVGRAVCHHGNQRKHVE
jgi:hypothetical protein